MAAHIQKTPSELRKQIAELEKENERLRVAGMLLAESLKETDAAHTELLVEHFRLLCARKPKLHLTALGEDFMILVEDMVKSQLLQTLTENISLPSSIRTALASHTSSLRASYFDYLRHDLPDGARDKG